MYVCGFVMDPSRSSSSIGRPCLLFRFFSGRCVAENGHQSCSRIFLAEPEGLGERDYDGALALGELDPHTASQVSLVWFPNHFP